MISVRERDDSPMLQNSDIEMQLHTERKGKYVPKSAIISPKRRNLFNQGTLQRGLSFATSGPLSGQRIGARAADKENDLRRRKIASALGPSAAGFGHHSGDKDDDTYKFEPLGMCNDIHCHSCRADYRAKEESSMTSGSSSNPWLLASLLSRIQIVHPNSKMVHWWNKFFVIACLVAIFIDPLFFFILASDKKDTCIQFNLRLAIALTVIRTMTDFIYLLHILLQSRLAYVARDSRIVGTGDFVTDPKRIAKNYIFSWHFVGDVFAIIPLPQILALGIMQNSFGISESTNEKNLLRVAFLCQYIPRIYRMVQLIGGVSANGFIFESAWANFIINLLMYILTGHVVGSCWYLLGLQRVNQCLKNSCEGLNLTTPKMCKTLLYCPVDSTAAANIVDRKNISFCFEESPEEFDYGIYQKVPTISSDNNLVSRYIYSLFWGFQQISTLAGNLEPSSYVSEVLFTMAIIGLGLLLFALLIGNIQNFLQALGRRRLEMQLRQRDVEQWMSHRRLPIPLRNHVREAERFSWTATRGVNEEGLLESLPENIQRDIRRHLFSFLKKVRIFTQVDDDPIFDFVSKRMRQTLYLKGTKIFEKKSPVEKIVFIVRGKVTSIGEDGNPSSLSEGDICGDELLACYLKHTSVNKDGKKDDFFWQGLRSTATVICENNVEAFCLYAADLENVNTQFTWYLQRPRVQGAIRYQSNYWRKNAATAIQREWRLRMRRLNKLNGSTGRTLESNR